MTTDSQPIRWEKVYVFISSTFGDMHAERDYLVKRVFPALQDWCERRRLRLVDIDLRWGVTEADTTSKRAVEVCLERINDCRPFFLCFLGQRHGWVPKAADVSDETFEKFPALREALQANASVTELEIRHAILKPFRSTAPEAKHPQPDIAQHAFLYFRDPGYLNDLRDAPRQLRCTFTDEVGPDDETEDERQQRERARDALRTLREATIPQDKPVIYQADWHAELTTPELTMPLECTGEWRRKWNRFAHLNLAATDERIPAEKLAAANEYNAALKQGRLAKFRLLAAPDTELAAIIQHDLQAAIQTRFPTHIEVAHEDELQKELDQQDGFLQACSEGFIERAGDFDSLDGYVADDSNKLFVLTAPGGMGKSTLLAKWIDRARTRLEAHPEQSLHFRFIGASDRSTTVYSLLRSLLGEMLATKKLDEELPADPNKLREALPELLDAIGKRGKTVIVLDALNQLESGLQDLHWLPRTLPANIKLIISLKRDDDASEQVYQQFHAAQAILSEVKPFANLDDRRPLVTAYLQQYMKELDESRIAALIATVGASNPLYLKVVLSELRVFGAFAGLAEKIRRDFGDNPVTAFQGVLKRLESDPAYSPIEPQRAVPLLFGLLANARHGLSVEELTSLFVQALKLEDTEQWRQAVADTINLLLRQVRPFLARREGRYDYFYESFKLAAQQRYVVEKGEETTAKGSAQKWHRLLADYFESLPTWQKEPTTISSKTDGQPTRRKVAELPYHLTQAEEWDRLEKTLCDLRFIEAKCMAGMTHQLIGDYQLGLATASNQTGGTGRDRVIEFSGFVEGQAHILREYPTLAFQQAANQPDNSIIAATAKRRLDSRLEKRAWMQWINKNQHHDPCLMTLVGHTQPVFACHYSADGRRILSASKEEYGGSNPWKAQAIELKLWNAETGEIIATLSEHDKNEEINTYAYSPRIGRIVSASYPLKTWSDVLGIVSASDGSLKMWSDVSGTEITNTIRHCSISKSPVFSPDGMRIVLSGMILDTETGAEIATITNSMVHTYFYSPDGKWIVTTPVATSTDHTIKVWDAEMGIEAVTLSGHYSYVEDCVVSSDSRLIAAFVSLDYKSRLIKVWSIVTGQEIATLHIKHHVKLLAFSQNSRQIVFVSENSLNLWTIEKRYDAATIAVRNGVETYAYSPDNKRLVYGGSSGMLTIWDAEKSINITTLSGHTKQIKVCAYSPDGKRIVSGAADCALKIWDAETYSQATTVTGHSGRVWSGAFSPDGKRVVSASPSVYGIKVWDVITGAEALTLPLQVGDQTNCSYSPTGNQIVSADGPRLRGSQNNRILRVWDPVTGKLIRTFTATGGLNSTSGLTAYSPTGLYSYSPDGSRVVAALEDGRLKIWDTQTGAEIATLAETNATIECATYSLDGKRIISRSFSKDNDYSIKVRDAETGADIQTLSWGTASAWLTQFQMTQSPDGKCIAWASDDRTLRFSDADAGKAFAELNCCKGQVSAFAFSQDGRRIVLGSIDNALRVWDVKMKKETMTLVGHQGWVKGCGYVAGDSQIVSWSGDNTLRVWDPKVGKELAIFIFGNSVRSTQNPQELIQAVAIENAGRCIFVGSAVGDVYILRLLQSRLEPPIVTSIRLWRFGYPNRWQRFMGRWPEGKWDKQPTTKCEWCGLRFVTPLGVMETIQSITINANLSLDQSPCIALPNEAWDEPSLLSECPQCHQPLRFNPFIVDNRERYSESSFES